MNWCVLFYSSVLACSGKIHPANINLWHRHFLYIHLGYETRILLRLPPRSKNHWGKKSYWGLCWRNQWNVRTTIWIIINIILLLCFAHRLFDYVRERTRVVVIVFKHVVFYDVIFRGIQVGMEEGGPSKSHHKTWRPSKSIVESSKSQRMGNSYPKSYPQHNPKTYENLRKTNKK